jgi:hypothetical protein
VKAMLIGRLIWRPFDRQFAEMLQRLEEHKQVFQYEVSRASAEESLRFFTKYEENVRKAEEQPGPDRRYYTDREEISLSWFPSSHHPSVHILI